MAKTFDQIVKEHGGSVSAALAATGHTQTSSGNWVSGSSNSGNSNNSGGSRNSQTMSASKVMSGSSSPGSSGSSNNNQTTPNKTTPGFSNSGTDLRRRADYANQVVQQGMYSVTYDELGYPTKAVKTSPSAGYVVNGVTYNGNNQVVNNPFQAPNSNNNGVYSYTGQQTQQSQQVQSTPYDPVLAGYQAKPQVQPVTQSQDYAKDIINLLTQGGKIDYNTLNSLAAARDAKINSDPSRYGNVVSTNDLISKYLPAAQQSEQMYLKSQNENKQINDLITLLQTLGQNGVDQMSYEDAQRQAQDRLNPQYDNARAQLATALDSDMEKRGIYNSPLASGIMTEKMGSLTNEQLAAIAQSAQTIQQNSNELSLQEKQLQSNTLNNLLSQLIGKQLNTAKLTGTLNGSNTLARDQFETNTSLAQAELTGKYNGQDTLAATNQKISAILSSVEMMGKVTTQEQADLLGVPVGTSTESAKQAAAQLQEQIREFNNEMSYKRASLSASNAAMAASSNAQKFANAMQVWQTTGSAPSGILQQYGVAPGTAYSSEYARSSQGKLEELQAQAELTSAEEEIQFQNRASSFMKMTGTDRNTAEACLLAVDATTDYNSAVKYLNANKSTLTQSGVNTTKATSALKNYFNISDKVNTVSSGSGYTNNSTSNYPHHIR